MQANKSNQRGASRKNAGPKGPERRRQATEARQRADRKSKKAPSKVDSNQTTRNGQFSTIGTAAMIRMPRIGFSDLLEHRVTYIAGAVYVGNGTLGATNGVYFGNAAKSTTMVPTNSAPPLVPVAPGDSGVGASYVNALLQLYRRVRYRKLVVHLVTVQSSTTNNAVVAIAPSRGPPGANEIPHTATDATAAYNLTNVMSMSGFKSCDSFENLSLDLTPYIAGGTGSKQNEFAVSTAYPSASTTVIGTTANLLGSCPTAFVIAGNSTVAGLQGTQTHLVIVEAIMDVLDFVGGAAVVDPIAVTGPRPGPNHAEKLVAAAMRARVDGDVARAQIIEDYLKKGPGGTPTP